MDDGVPQVLRKRVERSVAVIRRALEVLTDEELIAVLTETGLAHGARWGNNGQILLDLSDLQAIACGAVLGAVLEYRQARIDEQPAVVQVL